MAISTFIDRPRRGDGTIYGVPYTFRYESYEYELIDGTRWEEHKFDDMVDYVMRNIKSFEKHVLGKRPSPADLNDRRLFIVNENKKAQLKWDKEFNRKVVKLVAQAIEQGGVSLRVAHLSAPFIVEPLGDDEVTMNAPQYEVFHITYDSWLPESIAYTRCREQAEDAVRKSMRPPDLLPMV